MRKRNWKKTLLVASIAVVSITAAASAASPVPAGKYKGTAVDTPGYLKFTVASGGKQIKSYEMGADMDAKECGLPTFWTKQGDLKLKLRDDQSFKDSYQYKFRVKGTKWTAKWSILFDFSEQTVVDGSPYFTATRSARFKKGSGKWCTPKQHKYVEYLFKKS